MFNHIMIGTNDIDKAKAFYEKVLKVVGCEMAIDNTDAKGNKRVFFMHNGGTTCGQFKSLFFCAIPYNRIFFFGFC